MSLASLVHNGLSKVNMGWWEKLYNWIGSSRETPPKPPRNRTGRMSQLFDEDDEPSVWNTSLVFLTMIVLTILMLIAAQKLIGTNLRQSEPIFDQHAGHSLHP
jgi:hypothetical protein